jgi:arabinan endo-1,5-alpha-L-arabinosidase
MYTLKNINRLKFFFLLLFTIGLYNKTFCQSIVELSVHDPVMIKCMDKYYLFHTGNGIPVSSSKDLVNWKREKSVFSAPPSWAIEKVPSFKGHIWAPDITFYKGKYYLYYSISAFGKNTSCIGVTTNLTLDSSDPSYNWTDHGLVIESIPGNTNWNAIDPNFIIDENGNPFLSFGSFWDGIKLVKLNKDGLLTDQDLTKIPTIARRHDRFDDKISVSAGDNAIEAPFIYKYNDYYYLFVSLDYCCRGVNSTYKISVGRSKNLEGPYIDNLGVDMAKGGGKLVLEGNHDWYGVGHNAIIKIDTHEHIVFHGYDANDHGRSKLLIKKIHWNKDGWPTVN